MRKLSAFLGLAFIASTLASVRGMGTINDKPMRITVPPRPFLGYTVVSTRNNGIAPIPIDYYNSKRRQYGYSKHKAA